MCEGSLVEALSKFSIAKILIPKPKGTTTTNMPLNCKQFVIIDSSTDVVGEL